MELIENLPNEILVVFFAFISVMAYFIRQLIVNFGLSSPDQTQQQIHPDSEEAIHDTRRRLFGTSSARQANRQRVEGPDVSCPICLAQPVSFPIETNCGHVFCGRCFSTFCSYDSNNLHPARCPVCRQRVTLLLPGFHLDDARSLSDEDRRAVLDPLRHYNRRFSGEPRTWLELVMDIPTLMRHLINALFSESGLHLMLRIRIIIIMLFAAAYLLSPIDLLPESLLGAFGLLDDLFIFFVLAVYVTMIYRSFVAANPNFLGNQAQQHQHQH